MWKKTVSLFAVLFISMVAFAPTTEAATLYTPFTGISVSPGETVDYNVELINDRSSIYTATFAVENLPKDWGYTITADGRELEQLSVRGKDEQSLQLEIDVPLKVKKGTYEFSLVAKGKDGENTSLPFLVNVTEEGTASSDLEIEQPNMENYAGETFTYQATLRNRTASEQNFALTAEAPKGWDVRFVADETDVTVATLEPNESKDIRIEVTPPEHAKADSYAIPLKASSSSVTAEAEIEAIVSGTYELEVTTPSGNLSTDMTAGREKAVTVLVRNNGSAPVRDITLSAESPPNWEVTFDQEKVPVVEPEESVEVNVTIKADKDAIAGDYVTNIQAEAEETVADATFRVSVKTSIVWGFVGVIIIVAVIGALYYVFRTYGRR